MSNEKSSVDELAEQVGELTGAERAELFEGVRDDLLERYLQARGEYIDDLRERGLVGQYPDDSPWADYCREHPEDPMCHRILSQEGTHERQREYLDARRKYVERLREEDLLSFEMGGQVATHTGMGGGSGRVPLHAHIPRLDLEINPCWFAPFSFSCECNPNQPHCIPPVSICDRYPCFPGCPICGCLPNAWFCRQPSGFSDPDDVMSSLSRPTARTGFGGGTIAPGQTTVGVNQRMSAPMGASASLNPMLTPGPGPIPGPDPLPGPFPQPFPDRIRTPRIDICELYPCLCNPHSCECNPNQPHCWFDICKLNPCFCNPCSPGCPGYFSCQCNDWPWCNLTIPEGQFQPPVPSFFSGGAMYPAGAAAGGGQSPMAPMGASSYRYHGY